MHVLLINSFYEPNAIGGSERSVQTLAASLQERGHKVVVASLSIDQQDKQRTIKGIPVHYLADGNYGRSTADPRRTSIDRMLWHLSGEFMAGSTAAVRGLLRTDPPDIVHTNALGGMSCGPLWQAAKEKGLPIVHTLRDYHLLCARGVMFRRGADCGTPCLDCSLVARRRRAASAKVNAVVGISEFILKRHLDAGYFPRSTVRRVIFNAYRPPPALPPAVIGADGPLRIGYLGRLHPTKGIERLLSAVERVEGIELEVAGSGSDAYMHELQATPRERIHFSGHVEPQDFFGRIDMLVVPSLWAEPLGRVIIEAYAFGVPVVAAARGGIPELVREGQTGWLFDPDASDSLEARLRWAVMNRAALAAMRGACLHAAQAFLPERSIAVAYEEVYASLLNKAD